MIIRKENHDVVTLFSIGIVLSTTLVEYSANGRPLVTVEKSTQYAGQVHLTKKLNTDGSPQLI